VRVRAGSPDLTRTGRARSLDRRRVVRNDIRRQHGYQFDRIIVPVGETDDRPVAAEGDFRVNTDLQPDASAAEFYDGTDWRRVSHRAEVTFTATGIFAYIHGAGPEPQVVVKTSDGEVVQAYVAHLFGDTVVVVFEGTLTDAVLLLT